jgi:hypothetical protein
MKVSLFTRLMATRVQVAWTDPGTGCNVHYWHHKGRWYQGCHRLTYWYGSKQPVHITLAGQRRLGRLRG